MKYIKLINPQLPQEVINQVDKRRRSFLWAGNRLLGSQVPSSLRKCLHDQGDGGPGSEGPRHSQHKLTSKPSAPVPLRRFVSMGKLGQRKRKHRLHAGNWARASLGAPQFTATAVSGPNNCKPGKRKLSAVLVRRLDGGRALGRSLPKDVRSLCQQKLHCPGSSHLKPSRQLCQSDVYSSAA